MTLCTVVTLSYINSFITCTVFMIQFEILKVTEKKFKIEICGVDRLTEPHAEVLHIMIRFLHLLNT